jgi:hypothetical protein
MTDIFILEPTKDHIDIQTLDSGSLMLHCGTILSLAGAEQLKRGLMAILSGQFNRATTQADLEFDLARRSLRDSAPNNPKLATPTLGDL